jgi:hypothetical protein
MARARRPAYHPARFGSAHPKEVIVTAPTRPSLSCKATLAALALVLAGACGDDDDTPMADAAVAIDAAAGATDAAALPDAMADASTASAQCQALCNCMVSECMADLAACLTECATLAASALSCRTEHCGYAQTDPIFHCPHARGEDICP